MPLSHDLKEDNARLFTGDSGRSLMYLINETDDDVIPLREDMLKSEPTDTSSLSKETTQQQVLLALQGLAPLLGNTDGLENLATQNKDLLVQLASYLDGVESLLGVLNSNTDGIESLLSALGLKDDNVLTKLEAIRALMAGTISTKAVPALPRLSIIRSVTGSANTTIALGSTPVASLFADCTVINMKNTGTADILIFNAGQDPTVDGYPLPAGQGLAADLRLADLSITSTAAIKLTLWGGKESV